MDEPDPAPDIDLVPVGTILPFPRGRVHKDFYEFNGQQISAKKEPEVFGVLCLIEGKALEIFEAWGGSIGVADVYLPSLVKEQVQEMIWGISVKDGYDAVLAIRGKRSDSDENQTNAPG